MNRRPIRSVRSILRRKRRDRFLIAFAAAAWVFGCGSKETSGPAAQSQVPTTGTQEVVVEQFGILQKAIHEGVAATSGPARGVRVIRGGKDLEARLGIPLRDGDRIVTDASTRVVIGSETGPTISLDTNTDLTLRQASVFLGIGSLLMNIRRSFRLETEFVVAGVEGTELAMSLRSDDVMTLAVIEGKVRVETKGRKWNETYTEGEECVARGSSKPERRPLDAETRDRLLRWGQDFRRPTAASGVGFSR